MRLLIFSNYFMDNSFLKQKYEKIITNTMRSLIKLKNSKNTKERENLTTEGTTRKGITPANKSKNIYFDDLDSKNLLKVTKDFNIRRNTCYN